MLRIGFVDKIFSVEEMILDIFAALRDGNNDPRE